MVNSIQHSPQGVAFTELVLELFRLNGVLLAEGDRLGADIGLTSARWQVMGALADAARTVPQIAREMGLTRQGAQRTVNVLLAEEFVELRLNPDHKRAKLVQLTDIGRGRLDEVSARQVRWANAVSNGVTVADLKTAARVANTLRKALEADDG
ncbi:MAG: MarR family transcriptional regulator [Alphaproteobacteria bacterium]|nr:MarR family transcriptional regulator [Alphaproteobacteria bacterium]